MKQWQVQPEQGSARLTQVEVAPREPGLGETRIRVHAASLNFRDRLLVTGRYSMSADRAVVPLSDGAGEVTAVGPCVTRVAVGDRVTATTLPNWLDGSFEPPMRAQMIGFTLDGWLTEEIVLPDTALVKLPDGMSYEAAATLPCAGVTAWNAVIETARIGPGDCLLAQGTGGVSMFAVQLGKMVGARVIVTSSSDAKLERAKALGADDGVNYVTHPDWDAIVMELTGGAGVDLVIENAGTLRRSLQSTRWGGRVAIIGALATFGSGDTAPEGPLPSLLRSGVTVAPIMMGNRRMLGRMVNAYATLGIEPIIDKTFGFDQAPAAYDALAAADHIGKLVVTRPSGRAES